MEASKLNTSLTAKELVASFRNISSSKRFQLPSPPSQLGPPQSLQETDDGLTLLDCMSFFLGGAGSSAGSSRWRDSRMLVNLDAAMNTLSSDEGEQAWRHQDSQCSDNSSYHQDRDQHRRSTHRSEREHQGDTVNSQAPTSSWRRRRRSSSRHHRRCLDSFERVATDPSLIVETAPALLPHVWSAQATLHQAEATCGIFRCTEGPQPLQALPFRCPPALSSPSESSSPRRRSPHHAWPPQHTRHQGGGGDDWLPRGASSNCNAEGSLLIHRPRYRRSLQRRSSGDSKTDESLYITASTASPRPASARRSQRCRHLVTSPVPPCYRVRVPAGADAGRPPLKPFKNGPVAAFGFTRSAARTARSVRRHLSAALSKSRRRLFQAPGAASESPPAWQALQPPLPQSLPPAPYLLLQPPSPSLLSSLRRPLDLNNNRSREAIEDPEDFSSLLRTLERAHQQRRKRREQPQRPQSARSIEFLIDGRTQTRPAAADCVSLGSATHWSAESKASTCTTTVTPESSRASKDTEVKLSQQQLTRPPRDPELRRRIDNAINTMTESMMGLSASMQTCVERVMCTLAQMTQDQTH